MGQSGGDLDVFRREALEHRALPRQRGELLRISPAWMRSTLWLLLGMMALGITYLAVGQVNQYATGPAMLVDEGSVEIAAPRSAVVATVEVRTGQAIAAGQVMLRLQLDEGAQASAASPCTPGRAAGDGEPVRAPFDGRVAEVRVGPGQVIGPGGVLAVVARSEPSFAVVTFLPGHHRPRLHRGDPIRVELSGSPRSFQTLRIDALGDRLETPSDAARGLGRGIAELVAASAREPVVLARARLPVTPGATGGYFDGMVGTARVRVGSQSVLLTLLPGLEVLMR